MNKLLILTKGLVKENPVLVFMLGICPTLAISKDVTSALCMGVATTFVLICSNAAISLLRNVIPDKVRIPCYIVLIAGFVTFVQMVLEAYAFSLYQALGIFLPLITINCIIFSRAEMYAKKNTVLNSVLDAVGMGLGFMLAMVAMASVREVLGNGTWMGMEIPVLAENGIPLFTMAPGGFIVFGILIAIVNKATKGKAHNKKGFGCANCPSASICGKGDAK